MENHDPRSKTGNQLLDMLSAGSLARLGADLEPFELTFGREIHGSGEIASHVYFPTAGLISIIATMQDGASIEIGVAGHEGMFNVSTLLGDDAPFQRAIVQLPGRALRLRTRALRLAMLMDQPMQTTLLRYAQANLSAVGQSAACNRLHSVSKRCARWLLSSHDRADGDTFPMTHEFLATMLGVRRPGVTVAAQSLQSNGLIAYHHGSVSVLDRDGLEDASCECYRTIRDEHERLMGSYSS